MEKQFNFYRPRTRRCKVALTDCQDCGSKLSEKNWTPSNRKYKRYICAKCWVLRQKKYAMKNPLKHMERSKEYRRNRTSEKRLIDREKAYERTLKDRFGITLNDYYRLLKFQNNQCAICKTDKSDGRGRFHVDHCHKTGRIRGLLCSTCNLCLGKMNDDVERLQEAISYLKRIPLLILQKV